MLCIQLKLSQQMLLSERSCEYFLLIILLIQQELYSQKQKKVCPYCRYNHRYTGALTKLAILMNKYETLIKISVESCQKTLFKGVDQIMVCTDE